MAGIGSLQNNAINQLGLQQYNLLQSGLKLATGRQINSAADNPSGLAIFNALSSQAQGFDQGSLNAQDALNATNVAQGATSTISNILQDINVSAIQASNDFLGPSDRAAIQAQTNQEVQQINTIAQNTNFNGAQLLNGTFAGTTQASNATAQVNNNDLLAAGGNVVNTAAGITVPPATPSETIGVSVSAGQATVTLTDTATGNVTNVGSFAAGAAVTAGGVTFTLGNFSATDTGTATIQVTPGSAFAPGSPATVQTGATQGATSSLAFPSVTSTSLGVSNIDFATTSNAENAIGVVGTAIDTLSTAQSQLGAQTNALTEVINNNNIASVNLTASASNIADTNFPAETTLHNHQGIQQQITLAVLANANLDAGFLTSGLLNHAA
ncbi:MAG: flagellin [Candidatus Eremiobacteraeota bacterium]|nr:flagellin [Candidatus Eremiobacteraeota bacterium]